MSEIDNIQSILSSGMCACELVFMIVGKCNGRCDV